MKESAKKKEGKKKVIEVTTFPVPFALREIKKESIYISTNQPSQPAKEQIINKAFKFHSQGNIAEATKYYQYFIDQGLDDHRVFSNYGLILKNLGNLKEAERYTRKAIELNPDFAEAHYNLGGILNNIGNLKEAEIYTRKAIQLNPDFAEAYSNLGGILLNLGNLKEAEIYTRKAILLNPNYANSHSNLGGILNNIGNLKEAEIYTRKAIQLNPNYANAHYNLGGILNNIGNIKEAEISTRKAIQLNPDYAEAHSNLGLILRDIGNLQEAEISTQKAIKLNPNLATCYQNLSLLLYAKGNINLAIKNIEKAFSIDNISKDNQLLLYILRDRKNKEYQEISNPMEIGIHKKKSASYPIILKRSVDPELINSLYKIKAIDLNKFKDPSYGNAKGSDYKLFEDNEKITEDLEKDLTSITKEVVNSDVFFRDSFFTILSGDSTIVKHNHIGPIDEFSGLNLWKQKYSLVYYLSIGDQDCKNPGLLKFYPDKYDTNSNQKILPTEGMIIIFPADRYHSVKYEGKKDRIIIGVNFYSI